MKTDHRARRRALLTSAAAPAIALALMATGVQAQESAKTFAIAPQPLADALLQLSKQADIDIVASTDLTRGRVAPKVAGEMTTADAMSALLAGSGLVAAPSGTGYVIARASDPQSGSAAGDGADSGTVQALVVTAQKREENIQDVPIAMSAFTQEDLTRSQVAGGPDLMTQIPNMTFTKTNFSGYSIQIRGIGTQAISATTDPAVAVAFNNTPFIRNRFFEQEFYDLERVEVLRGPQGTLYGRNATAGVVNLISAKPKGEFQARLSADVANYNSSRLEGMINLPLVQDKAALRIAGAWTKRDGFVKNTITGEQIDGRDLWSTRVTLGLTPTDNFSANLIWEHFKEDDGRLRSGKQLCRRDNTPDTATTNTQGCLPASLYSPDSFQTPNGTALGYYGALGGAGSSAGDSSIDPYLSHYQSRNLREIETRIKPEYTADTDTVELQLKLDLPHNLTLASETGYLRDYIFSFEDFNRFNTSPHVFVPGGYNTNGSLGRFDIVDHNGIYCDPQLGCSDRMMAGDLDTATSKQFSQEFRLSSDFEGPFNFNVGANFLHYRTEEKYYVFINNITSHYAFTTSGPWVPGVTDNGRCVVRDFYGPTVSNPNTYYNVFWCGYIDPGDIHHLNDNGRNYFLSKNPYDLLSYAAFGEAYFNITPDLKLTAGLRWTVDKKTAPQIPSWLTAAADPANWGGGEASPASTYGLPVRKVIHQEWRKPTGRLAIDWKPKLSFTDDTLVYASYVHGYKAGGANPPPPMVVMGTVCPPQCGDSTIGGPDLLSGILHHFIAAPETFKPEYVNAYEVGSKNTLLDGRLTANLSAFYYDYTGYQISEIVDRAASNLNFDAKIWGGELELDWRPLENLRLGFKGGYENTRVAKGMKAIDLRDRTAGMPGWVVKRPFATMPSNCIFPAWVLESGTAVTCATYFTGLDPITYLPYVPNPTVSGADFSSIPPGYPGFDPSSANYGEGFYKDLSGHQLPNAPKFTATITADYTIPLPNDWLATLHADLYHQSEAWTRIFNDPGYDKLKAYNNVNLAAIFSNEDRGWQVMAYVKNVLNKDNITGAFLNSDDTGLTTNVFLNEPRLFGLRVTKNWAGGAGPFGGPHTPGTPYPFTVEFGGQMMRTSAPGKGFMPFADAFSPALDPRQPQLEHLDWTHSPEVRFSYRPAGSPWKLAADFRYGRIINETPQRRFEEVAGPTVCFLPRAGAFPLDVIARLSCDPGYEWNGVPSRYYPNNLAHPKNRVGVSAGRSESHAIADFEVGKDVGLGLLGVRSSVGTGLRFAEFKSLVSSDMTGVTHLNVAEGWALNTKYPSSFDHYTASIKAEQKFEGAGPILSWDASRPLLGERDKGEVDVDWTLIGGVLFGRQTVSAKGVDSVYHFAGGNYADINYAGTHWRALPTGPSTPVNFHRSTSATVPTVDFSLGLSYQVPGVKIGAGYRWERYFNVLDAGGVSDHKSFDRTLDGPYIKFSLGFGG